jgi:hypothetical protein
MEELNALRTSIRAAEIETGKELRLACTKIRSLEEKVNCNASFHRNSQLNCLLGDIAAERADYQSAGVF